MKLPEASYVAAGYYSCLSYSTAQLLIEVPYLLGLAIMFVSIVSPSPIALHM